MGVVDSLIWIILITNRVYSTQCTYSNATDNFVTYCDLNNTLRTFMKDKFDFTVFHDFIAKMVRLVFHDCMGQEENNLDDNDGGSICDGCLDSTNPSHSNLTENAIRWLDRQYTRENWQNKISRADWWAAIATIAIQYSSELAKLGLHNQPNRTESLPYIPFYIGRSDCSAAPDINIANYKTPYKSFPDALAGWDYNFNFFKNTFGFNEQEYVAILGAHTLGQVHGEDSGFGDNDGDPWVQGWDLLENSFYHVMLDDELFSRRSLEWIQVLNDNNAAGKVHWEWHNNGSTNGENGRFIFLNADFGLIFDMEDNLNAKNGKCSCKFDSCGDNTHTDEYGKTPKEYVQAYADDNQLWLNDFASAFNRLIRNGYDNVNSIPNDLDILAEDWYLIENDLMTTIEPLSTKANQSNNIGTVNVTINKLILFSILLIILTI